MRSRWEWRGQSKASGESGEGNGRVRELMGGVAQGMNESELTRRFGRVAIGGDEVWDGCEGVRVLDGEEMLAAVSGTRDRRYVS